MGYCHARVTMWLQQRPLLLFFLINYLARMVAGLCATCKTKTTVRIRFAAFAARINLNYSLCFTGLWSRIPVDLNFFCGPYLDLTLSSLR